MPGVPPRQHIGLRVSAEVGALLDQLAERRGLTKTEILVTGVLAQAEAFGLIPSVAATISKLLPEPPTDPEVRRRQRLSQQRTRARRRGEPVPKLKSPGRPRKSPRP